MVLALQHRFANLFRQYDSNESRLDRYWFEIQKSYSEKHRHYHNLMHLSDLFAELDAVAHAIEHYELIEFAVFYHDIIYQTTSKKNELKSAKLARSRMLSMGLSPADCELVYDMICATQSHAFHGHEDTQYLLDADLAILGKPVEIYDRYAQQIRQEFKLFPNFLYNPGRRKVLEHFLQNERIYQTSYFVAKYEAQALHNLQRELASYRNK